MSKLVLISLSAGLLFAAGANAQPAPAAKPAPMAKPAGQGPPPAADRSPISKACSAQADAKNLHGKPRDKFRRACMKGAKA